MAIAILIKAIVTALIIISVAKGVERLGPRFGGILAGAPVIIGPAYFFLVTEHDVDFVIDAALSSMNAMSATLVFSVLYQLLPRQQPLWLTLLLASLAWLASVLLLQHNIKSTLFATITFVATFLLVKSISRHTRATPNGQNKGNSFDIVYRAIAAGVLVGIGAGLAHHTGPALSGAIVGYPIGLTTIVITLHHRHGPDVPKATMVSAQTGITSIFAFLLTLVYLAASLPLLSAFLLAILAALLTTSSFLLFEFFASPCLSPSQMKMTGDDDAF